MSKIGIVGSHRKWTPETEEAAKDYIEFIVSTWIQGGELTIVSGGAVGVDTWAAEEAGRTGAVLVEHLPDREKYGWPAAAFIRNKTIAEDSDMVYALYSTNEISPGSASTVKHALSLGKDCFEWHPKSLRWIQASSCHSDYTYHAKPHKDCHVKT